MNLDFNIVAFGISILVALVAFFGGYWFSNTNKKTDTNRGLIHANQIDINNNTKELATLRLANEKAELDMKQSMKELASDMRKMTSNLSSIGITVMQNKNDIKNLQAQHNFIAETIRRKNKAE